jgi:hypothetical protein
VAFGPPPTQLLQVRAGYVGVDVGQAGVGAHALAVADPPPPARPAVDFMILVRQKSFKVSF